MDEEVGGMVVVVEEVEVNINEVDTEEGSEEDSEEDLEMEEVEEVDSAEEDSDNMTTTTTTGITTTTATTQTSVIVVDNRNVDGKDSVGIVVVQDTLRENVQVDD